MYIYTMYLYIVYIYMRSDDSTPLRLVAGRYLIFAYSILGRGMCHVRSEIPIVIENSLARPPASRVAGNKTNNLR